MTLALAVGELVVEDGNHHCNMITLGLRKPFNETTEAIWIPIRYFIYDHTKRRHIGHRNHSTICTCGVSGLSATDTLLRWPFIALPGVLQTQNLRIPFLWRLVLE